MKFFSRMTRRGAVSPKLSSAKPRMERLEDRITPSFGPGDGAYIVEPWGGRYYDVQIQPGDQKIVAAGEYFGSGVAVARYDSVGNPDANYGSGGVATPQPGTALGLALQPDGKAVVDVSLGGDLGVARLTADGSLDNDFGSGGSTSVDFGQNGAYFGGVGLQSTGKIVMAGYQYTSQPSGSLAIVARFTASGALDSGSGGFGTQSQGYTVTTFGSLYTFFVDLAVQPDDKLVVSGSLVDGNSVSRIVVARYTLTGALDTTFNSSGYSVLAPSGISNLGASKVALQADGKIVVAGYCSGVDGVDDMIIARFNANGNLDTGFGSGNGYVRLDIDGTASPTQERPRGLAIQPDGKILAVATLVPQVAPNYVGSVMVARLNSNGILDSTFGGAGFKVVAPPVGQGYHHFDPSGGLALQSDGSIIVAGADYWANTGSAGHPMLLRFFGSPPTIAGTQVNDGSQQHSRVTSLSVTFDTQVSFAGTLANAFTLTRIGGGSVAFNAAANTVGGVTVVTLNNLTGSETQSGSLADGRYTLTALASQISANGQQMASNYTFGDAQGLFRYYGDMNGDRRVDISDFGFFSLAYLTQANYNPALDFNNDGRIDIADFGQFSVRFFTTLP